MKNIFISLNRLKSNFLVRGGGQPQHGGQQHGGQQHHGQQQDNNDEIEQMVKKGLPKLLKMLKCCTVM